MKIYIWTVSHDITSSRKESVSGLFILHFLPKFETIRVEWNNFEIFRSVLVFAENSTLGSRITFRISEQFLIVVIHRRLKQGIVSGAMCLTCRCRSIFRFTMRVFKSWRNSSLDTNQIVIVYQEKLDAALCLNEAEKLK